MSLDTLKNNVWSRFIYYVGMPIIQHSFPVVAEFIDEVFSEHVQQYQYRPFAKIYVHPVYKKRGWTTEQKREKRLQSLPQQWSAEVWKASREYWHYKCAACYRKVALEKDHIVPLYATACPGNIPTNLLPLCYSCNKGKGAEDLTIWHLRKFRDPVRTIKFIRAVWLYQDYMHVTFGRDL